MQIQVNKAAVAANAAVSDVDMALINAQALKELTPEEVFVFKLEACNDQIDRDHERFATNALPALAKMFVGKTMICDHFWSATKQTARIYKTSVERRENRSSLIVECYMLRNESTKDTIAAINGGILREVSVGCAMGKAVCSICGEEYGTCGHQKGVTYDGTLCYCELQDPVDAYELSWVAVPAQPLAGVTKQVNHTGVTVDDISAAKAALEIENERWRYL